MGHDISGYNKAGKEIAYARFSMGNYNAIVLYGLLDADKFNAGVSGSGNSMIYSNQQIEEALNSYSRLYGHYDVESENDSSNWDLKQIRNFIFNCLTTTQNEGQVRVVFC